MVLNFLTLLYNSAQKTETIVLAILINNDKNLKITHYSCNNCNPLQGIINPNDYLCFWKPSKVSQFDGKKA